jgi:hypothetical protein
MRDRTAELTPSARVEKSVQVDRWFFIVVAIAMILFNVFAFAPSLIDQSRRNVPLPLPLVVTLHAAVAAAWLVLFLTQATLAATSRIAVHRRLGVVGAVLSVAFVVLGYFTVIDGARRGFDLSGDIGRAAPPGATGDPLAVTSLLLVFVQFAVLIGVALWYRDRPPVHRRLMLLALLGTLTATPVAHALGYWIGPRPIVGLISLVLGLFFLSLSALHDKIAEGRIHPVSIWVPILLTVSGVLFNFAVLPTAWWRQFAERLIQ